MFRHPSELATVLANSAGQEFAHETIQLVYIYLRSSENEDVSPLFDKPTNKGTGLDADTSANTRVLSHDSILVKFVQKLFELNYLKSDFYSPISDAILKIFELLAVKLRDNSQLKYQVLVDFKLGDTLILILSQLLNHDHEIASVKDNNISAKQQRYERLLLNYAKLNDPISYNLVFESSLSKNYILSTLSDVSQFVNASKLTDDGNNKAPANSPSNSSLNFLIIALKLLNQILSSKSIGRTKNALITRSETFENLIMFLQVNKYNRDKNFQYCSYLILLLFEKFTITTPILAEFLSSDYIPYLFKYLSQMLVDEELVSDNTKLATVRILTRIVNFNQKLENEAKIPTGTKPAEEKKLHYKNQFAIDYHNRDVNIFDVTISFLIRAKTNAMDVTILDFLSSLVESCPENEMILLDAKQLPKLQTRIDNLIHLTVYNRFQENDENDKRAANLNVIPQSKDEGHETLADDITTFNDTYEYHEFPQSLNDTLTGLEPALTAHGMPTAASTSKPKTVSHQICLSKCFELLLNPKFQRIINLTQPYSEFLTFTQLYKTIDQLYLKAPSLQNLISLQFPIISSNALFTEHDSSVNRQRRRSETARAKITTNNNSDKCVVLNDEILNDCNNEENITAKPGEAKKFNIRFFQEDFQTSISGKGNAENINLLTGFQKQVTSFIANFKDNKSIAEEFASSGSFTNMLRILVDESNELNSLIKDFESQSSESAESALKNIINNNSGTVATLGSETEVMGSVEKVYLNLSSSKLPFLDHNASSYHFNYVNSLKARRIMTLDTMYDLLETLNTVDAFLAIESVRGLVSNTEGLKSLFNFFCHYLDVRNYILPATNCEMGDTELMEEVRSGDFLYYVMSLSLLQKVMELDESYHVTLFNEAPHLFGPLKFAILSFGTKNDIITKYNKLAVGEGTKEAFEKRCMQIFAQQLINSVYKEVFLKFAFITYKGLIVSEFGFNVLLASDLTEQYITPGPQPTLFEIINSSIQFATAKSPHNVLAKGLIQIRLESLKLVNAFLYSSIKNNHLESLKLIKDANLLEALVGKVLDFEITHFRRCSVSLLGNILSEILPQDLTILGSPLSDNIGSHRKRGQNHDHLRDDKEHLQIIYEVIDLLTNLIIIYNGLMHHVTNSSVLFKLSTLLYDYNLIHYSSSVSQSTGACSPSVTIGNSVSSPNAAANARGRPRASTITAGQSTSAFEETYWNSVSSTLLEKITQLVYNYLGCKLHGEELDYFVTVLQVDELFRIALSDGASTSMYSVNNNDTDGSDLGLIKHHTTLVPLHDNQTFEEFFTSFAKLNKVSIQFSRNAMMHKFTFISRLIEVAFVVTKDYNRSAANAHTNLASSNKLHSEDNDLYSSKEDDSNIIGEEKEETTASGLEGVAVKNCSSVFLEVPGSIQIASLRSSTGSPSPRTKSSSVSSACSTFSFSSSSLLSLPKTSPTEYGHESKQAKQVRRARSRRRLETLGGKLDLIFVVLNQFIVDFESFSGRMKRSILSNLVVLFEMTLLGEEVSQDFAKIGQPSSNLLAEQRLIAQSMIQEIHKFFHSLKISSVLQDTIFLCCSCIYLEDSSTGFSFMERVLKFLDCLFVHSGPTQHSASPSLLTASLAQNPNKFSIQDAYQSPQKTNAPGPVSQNIALPNSQSSKSPIQTRPHAAQSRNIGGPQTPMNLVNHFFSGLNSSGGGVGQHRTHSPASPAISPSKKAPISSPVGEAKSLGPTVFSLEPVVGFTPSFVPRRAPDNASGHKLNKKPSFHMPHKEDLKLVELYWKIIYLLCHLKKSQQQKELTIRTIDRFLESFSKSTICHFVIDNSGYKEEIVAKESFKDPFGEVAREDPGSEKRRSTFESYKILKQDLGSAQKRHSSPIGSIHNIAFKLQVGQRKTSGNGSEGDPRSIPAVDSYDNANSNSAYNVPASSSNSPYPTSPRALPMSRKGALRVNTNLNNSGNSGLPAGGNISYRKKPVYSPSKAPQSAAPHGSENSASSYQASHGPRSAVLPGCGSGPFESRPPNRGAMFNRNAGSRGVMPPSIIRHLLWSSNARVQFFILSSHIELCYDEERLPILQVVKMIENGADKFRLSADFLQVLKAHYEQTGNENMGLVEVLCGALLERDV